MSTIKSPPSSITHARSTTPSEDQSGSVQGENAANAEAVRAKVVDKTPPTDGSSFSQSRATDKDNNGTTAGGHRDLRVAANQHISVDDTAGSAHLVKAAQTLVETSAALPAETDDHALVAGALAATNRASKQISAKAPVRVALLNNKDGVLPSNLLGTVKKRDGVATFVPHNQTISPFVLPAALAQAATDGRVVRLVRDGGPKLLPPTTDPAAQVEVSLESAASGQSRARFIGPVVVDNGQAFVEDPYHAGGSVRVPLSLGANEKVAAGDIVDVTVDDSGQATLKGAPLAPAGSARAQMYGIFARHQIDPTFPPDVMDEVAALQKNDGIQSGLDSGELKDFRDKAFVTIDNADSRDLDQAMYIEKHKDGSFDVYYALADASHYVKPGTALFRESMKRAASYYLPGLAVPMLPAELSEDLVSLNAGKDRRAMVMKLTVDKEGKSAGTSIERGVINSRAKLAYERTTRASSEP